MRIREHVSGDIFVEDTIPFDFIDIQHAAESIEDELDTIVAEWPIIIDHVNGVWQLIFVNPFPQEYLDFPELV